MPPPAENPLPDTLPFPVGPLLRPATVDVNALAGTPYQRSRMALAVLRREYEAVHQMNRPNSKLTGLMALKKQD